jgi:hypothetical protein
MILALLSLTIFVTITFGLRVSSSTYKTGWACLAMLPGRTAGPSVLGREPWCHSAAYWTHSNVRNTAARATWRRDECSITIAAGPDRVR